MVAQLISTINASLTNWLPGIERPADHHQVQGRPVVLYTSGITGKTNKELIANRVYAGIE